MSLTKNILLSTVLLAILGLAVLFRFQDKNNALFPPIGNGDEGGEALHPLEISAMKERAYPGGEIKIERDLGNQGGFVSYVISYPSDGLKLYALMDIPNENPPLSGWPVIILNHGYIPPTQYSTVNSYKAFSDYFARNGFLVLKPDYRGHANSEGDQEGGHFSPGYTYDVLNLLSSVKRYPYANPEKIGMWGHSMGGNVTLRSIVVTSDVKASVIAAGVVGSAEDLFYNWRRRTSFRPPPWWATASARTRLVKEYGEPKENPQFWNKISAINYVDEIFGPIQIHHGTSDESVPKEFSDSLNLALE
ncbi:alpha/beta hydrolase, partial [Candidatus Curtissbacteria bacterium]|nr:alpha/beta hydrolase [Candidatus Curtissbacteria bacterium]